MKNLSAVLLYLSISFSLSAGDISVQPSSWVFGQLSQGEKAVREVVFTNNGASGVNISVLPACDCLAVEPGEASVAPGEKKVFILTYDSSGDSGKVEKHYVIRTTHPDLPKAFFAVTGSVVADETDEAAAGRTALPESGAALLDGMTGPAELQIVKFSYYYSAGCGACTRFLEKNVKELEARENIRFEVNSQNILDPEAYEEYLAVMKERNVSMKAFPALILGNTVLQGEKTIESSFENAVLAVVSGREWKSEDQENRQTPPLQEGLVILPVLAAGLLDGVNPCAFTTIIFLITALAVAGRKRKEILVIGAFFTLTVFVTYFFIGLGLFNALRAASVFPLIAGGIRYVLAAVLVLLAAASFYDFLLVRSGKTSEMLLQLPMFLKRKIHSAVHSHLKSRSLIAASIVLGVMVSVFELACTGQVYFPAIAYLVRVEQKSSGFFFLTLYNLGFILPLAAVFLLSWAGTGMKTITGVFQKNIPLVKILFIVLFVLMAFVTIVV